MYLKSIEVHGFKSFANKIVFDFHNGITGIVGPNGSGKSNVADAVRWVLGEQRARQLRGASMQDVIFAGTENRKPLSYAMVAITLDNSDHHLAIDYEEVTVTRKVYRSGESEYLINGSPCRLKDVNELFYDTGIGKEGYSIIGQGQIDRILNGKPEERRELFDEAAGIVKFKRRKATAVKKLADERENLIRVNDILTEQERQLAPLEKQSETARIYIKKKEELKKLDVNMFLMEVERIERQLETATENFRVADQEYKETTASYENIKAEYEKMELEIEQMDAQINETRESISETSVTRQKLEGQINVLKEQILAAKASEEHFSSNMENVNHRISEKQKEKEGYQTEKAKMDENLSQVTEQTLQAAQQLEKVQSEIAACNQEIEKGKNEIIEMLNNKASIKARQQRYDTMLEQVNIRKAQLSQRLLQRKSEEAGLAETLETYKHDYEQVTGEINKLEQEQTEIESKRSEWLKKTNETVQQLEQIIHKRHVTSSKLESLRNIAERYDGYGNSIRKVMEQKEKHKGIHGVVADLIKVNKKYETAIETALGGNIQNVVTADETTAKEMVSYLKQNRFGRATFLPLTSVGRNNEFKNEKALKEEGVIGLANTLVEADSVYDGVMNYLLGRVVVVDTIDHAIALAKKNHYSLHIVTLEGEYLSPGGSISGGAFRNNSNLLGRNREIEELEKTLTQLEKEVKEKNKSIEEMKVARSLLKDDLETLKVSLQEKYLQQNTHKMNLDTISQQMSANEDIYAGLKNENSEIEKQLLEINQNKEEIIKEIEFAKKREEEIQQANVEFEKVLKEKTEQEEQALKAVSDIQMEEAGERQKAEFIQENIDRTNRDLETLQKEMESIIEAAGASKEDIEKKTRDIEEIEKTIQASDGTNGSLETKLKDLIEKKEQMSAQYKGFFQKREDISKRISELDKEIFRLNSQREKLEEAAEYQKNYMWEEYELTLHMAKEMRDESFDNLNEMKRAISGIKDEIRKLGDVNVNAIEDYKNLLERYEFLNNQRNDLVESEKTLLSIIDDLDTGMRKQFTEKFAEIQKEFDKAFKELFGGGKGTLELVEDEDILECGIRIIAQPPGKKLQNMMQLSGGEKALTAISLLFAIQNLKPSPFCLLDEIEAALDDSNVGRFADYLHKLTKNTQFIIITHRRGTMAAADRLYGITMQEKGVSTLVSVNLIENDLDS